MSPTSVQQIDEWRAAKSESEHLEFKEAKNQFAFDDLLRYCVAIGNEGGGQLLLGITNKPPRHVVGTSAFANTQKTASDLLNKLHFRVDVEEVAHPDGRVLIFHIPPRPLRHAFEVDGTYYMRSGESLVAMTPDRLKKIFNEPTSGRRLGPVSVLLSLLLVAAGFIGYRVWTVKHGLPPPSAAPRTSETGTNRPSLPHQASPAQRSYLVIDGALRLPLISIQGQTVQERNFQVNDEFQINIFVKQEGPNPIDVVETSPLIYLKPDHTPETQDAIVADFEKRIQKGRKLLPPQKELPTLGVGEHRFYTAFAPTETDHRRVVTQKDLDQLRIGDEILFVIVKIIYRDQGRFHTLRKCDWLRPPASMPTVWFACERFNHSD